MTKSTHTPRQTSPTSTGGDTGAYLKTLGERVRSARARRGMTRKILALDSGVSERYLAQLESGQGNISIVLLRQVADAMSLPVTELVREGSERPVEITLITQLLERLTPEELSESYGIFAAHYGDVVDGQRAARVALVGLRGAGKTTLGGGLAAHLGVPFVRLASEIEQASGMTLSEIFSLSGQAAYRRWEKRALERIFEEHPKAVIETGGSLVSEAATYGLLLDACFTVWIKASPEEHMARVVAQGDTRPMAGNSEAMKDLRQILEGRGRLYATADASIDTSGKSVEASLAELIGLLPEDLEEGLKAK